MSEHRPSREELRQREKEARSRQKIQEQARWEAEQDADPFDSVPLPPEYAGLVSAPFDTKPKKKKKKLLIVLIIVAVVFLLAAALHAFFIHAPELPSDPAEEGTAPGVLGTGRWDGVYTFLLVGRDDKEGGGGNTDTIMVGCFDTEKGTLDVLSIFRDTLVDVPWEIKKINSVYNMQGLDGLKEQIKNLIGYKPDYYFVMELSAVAEVVDALGGVSFEVPCNMDYDDPTQDLHIHFAKGLQHLNGEDAVKVLRWRKNNSGEALSVGDVGRVEIQHDFLKALASQAIRPETLPKIKEIARIVDRNLTSDLTYGEMLWFGEKALGLQQDGIRFHSLPGDYTGTIWSPTYQNYQSYVFVNADELRSLVNQYMNPYIKAITPDMQNVLDGTTAGSGGKTSSKTNSKTASSPSFSNVSGETESLTGTQPVTKAPKTTSKPAQSQPETSETKPEPSAPPQTTEEPKASEVTPEPYAEPTPEPATPAAEPTPAAPAEPPAEPITQ